MNIKDYKVILASKSPRRSELLKQVGVEFEVIPAVGEEIITESDPRKVVAGLSHDKAMEISAKCQEGCLIIGADTVVAIGDTILGKPTDKEDAFSMIKRIRNGCHSVYTGVTIVCKENKGDVIRTFVCETKVYVYDMTDEEILAYIATEEPMDKAGAYGIQGAFAEYVERIEGDYNNVVGLPVSALLHEIKQMEV